MRRGSILILLILFSYPPVYCQDYSPGFAKYLFENRNFEDLVQLDLMDKSHLDKYQIDSVNYYTGMAFYNLQELTKSSATLLSVSTISGFYNHSRFFAGWSNLYLGRYSEAEAIISQARPISSAENELLQMFKTGLALMNRDIGSADSIISLAAAGRPVYLPQWNRMEIHSERLDNFKPKSYAIAGLLSSLVPGTGKIYAGQKGAGISSFLSVGTMAAITLENGIKTGWGKWNTIVSAGIFTIFYVGNIYGSIVGVRVYRERFFNEFNRAILLDINIPLRNLYL